MRHALNKLPSDSRRNFLLKCAHAAFGLSVASTLPSSLCAGDVKSSATNTGKKPGFGKAKRVIFIQLDGGLSHIDSFDPKDGDAKGPASTIKTTGDFQLTSYFPKIADLAKHLCVIRSMNAKIAVHAPAQYLMRTGFPQRTGIRHPVLGAWAQHYLGPSHTTMPSSVALCRRSDEGNGFLPVMYSPLAIGDPNDGLSNATANCSEEKFSQRLKMMDQLDNDFRKRYQDSNVAAYSDFYAGAIKLMQSSDLTTFDLSKEPQAVRDAYGKTNFGQGCLLARRLISSGTRFVEIVHKGWDFHSELEAGFEEKAPELDQVYSALISDLEQQGLLDSTLVVLATEFGRSPGVKNGGRGHYPLCFSTVLAGAGVKKGYAYGASDKTGANPTDKDMSVGDFHATIAHAMGMPIEKGVDDANGRPFFVGDRGKAALGVFA